MKVRNMSKGILNKYQEFGLGMMLVIITGTISFWFITEMFLAAMYDHKPILPLEITILGMFFPLGLYLVVRGITDEYQHNESA